MRTITTRTLATAIVLTAIVCLPASAGDLNVSWNPSTGATGYRLHFGTSPSQYDTTIDVGTQTQINVSTLGDCTMWYFAATAYNAGGESGYSTEVASWPRPILTQASPGSGEQGRQLDVTLTGTNFQSGAVVSFSDPAITLNSASVTSCNELSLNVTIGSGAAVGPVVVTVTQPNGVAGQSSAVFSVVADTTAPAISGIAATAIGSTTATIDWDTDEASSSQVLYRKVGDNDYQQTSVDSTLVTQHSVALQGLAPDTTYELEVHSVDAAGNAASDGSGPTFTTSSNAFTYFRIEGESGDLGAPVGSVTGSGAFGGAWIEMLSGNGNPSNPNGTASFGANLPASGDWFVWIRVYAPNAASDSWAFRINGASWSTLTVPGTGQWLWLNAGSATLSSGLHSVQLGGVDTGARADRIVLTDDPGFVPTEQPGDDQTAPSAATQFTAAPGDGSNSLGWTNPSDADVARIVIRYRTDGVYPQSAVDGFAVLDAAATPGSQDSHTHQGLTNGVTYYYSAFAVDASGNVAPAAQAEATPQATVAPPAPPTNLAVN